MRQLLRPTLIISFILPAFLLASCSSEQEDSAAESTSSAIESMTEKVAETTESVVEKTAEATEAVAEKAAETTEAVVEKAAEATEAVVEKTQEVVEETTEAVATAVAPAANDNGKTTYDSVCFACHAMGIAGAPKQGDKEAWASRIAQGNEVLYDRAINGFTGPTGSMMPAKGGRVDISDEDIKAAVDYMVAAAQ